MIRTVAITLSLLISVCAAYAQNMNIGQSEASVMKKNAKETVEQFLGTIGTISFLSLNESKLVIEDLKRLFERSSTRVHNNLLSGGSDDYDIDTYLRNIHAWYPNGLDVTYEIAKVSDIFVSQAFNGYFVKVIADVKTTGTDNKGNYQNNTKKLDFYLKYFLRSNFIDPNPKIYNVSKNQNNEYQFVKAQIVSEGNASSLIDIDAYEEYIEEKDEFAKRRQDLDDAIISAHKAQENAESEAIKALEARRAAEREKEKYINKRQEADNIINDYKRAKEKTDEERQEYIKKQKIAEEQERLAKLERMRTKTKKFAINIGGGMYTHMGTLPDLANKIDATGDENLSAPYINLMLGLRFDFPGFDAIRNFDKKKYLKGNIFGLFGRYGINNQSIVDYNISQQMLSIDPARIDAVYNPYIEVEAGFLFMEVFRISSGFGRTNVFGYYVSSAGLNLNIGRIKIDGGLSALYGNSFVKTSLRPYVGAAFQFNDSERKKIRYQERDGLLVFGAGYERTYYYFEGVDKFFTDQQITSLLGIKLGSGFKRQIMGVFASYGFNRNDYATNILLTQQKNNELSANNEFNDFVNIEGGFLFNQSVRLSAGITNFNYINNVTLLTSKMKTYSVTTGYHVRFLRYFKLNLDIALLLNEEFKSPMYKASAGLSLMFDFAKVY